MPFSQRQKITVLKNNGFRENIDFRVVWFNEKAEIKPLNDKIKKSSIL